MNYRALYLLPIAISALIMLGTYRANITVEKIVDPSVIVLPDNLKRRLLTEADSELLYVDYSNKTIKYYFRSNNEIRCNLILNVMRKLIISLRYNFLAGKYLFVLHDGAHHAYEQPILAYATRDKFLATKDVVLIPDPWATMGYKKVFMGIDQNINKYKWRNKISKIFWRGSAYGVGPECNDINGCDRFRFMHYAAKLDFVDAGFTSYTLQLNSQLRERLETMYGSREWVSPADSLAYKYLIDVDGNSCAYSRMAWILYSNSVLMKHKSDLVQWYYAQLQPNVHYLPINADFGNLEEQFLWAEAHPQEAKVIAANSRRLARKVFNTASIMHSMEQSLLEYHALVTDHAT